MSVLIYADGACAGNPGPGGYGAIIVDRSGRKEISGGYVETTNNRMELMAVIKGIDEVQTVSDIQVYSDSKYVIDGMNVWMKKWIISFWRTSTGKPVLNQDLWKPLKALSECHTITFSWVKGHFNHLENNRADELANNAIYKGNWDIDRGYSYRPASGECS